MPTLKDIQGAATKPSYDDWLRGVADSYANNQWESLGFSAPAGGAGSKATEDLYNKLKDNPAFSKLYDQGITADQITTAPLSNAGAFDAGGFGTFGGKDYGNLTDAQKHLVDSGAFVREYNPTMGNSGEGATGGYYWQATDKAPGVLGSKGPAGGTAQFTQFDPFNSKLYNNNANFAFDPNYGLVTSQLNVHKNPLDEIIYQAAPMLAIGALTAGIGSAALAGGGAEASGIGGLTNSQLGNLMMKVPGIAQTLGEGGDPTRSILSLGGSIAGVPSWATSLANTGYSAARGASPMSTGMSLAQLLARYGIGGG